MFDLEEMPPFPPNSNPMVHDRYHMGTNLGSNVMILHENHTNAPAQYLIIVHRPTGQRVRVMFPEFKDRTAAHPDLFVALQSPLG